MIKAVAFDYGDTIMESKFPLSWQEFYRDAILNICKYTGLEPDPERVRSGEETFLKYNTRVNPREYEVDSTIIFSELFRKWGIDDHTKIKPAKDAFALFFQGQSELYPDALPVLRKLKEKKFKIGVLTNVAYGLDKEYLMQNITEIIQYIDVFLTSTDIGFRKPNPAGYKELAKRLDTDIKNCVFVGDEDVDIIGANDSGMVSVLIDRKGNNNDYGQLHTIRSLHEVLSLI